MLQRTFWYISWRKTMYFHLDFTNVLSKGLIRQSTLEWRRTGDRPLHIAARSMRPQLQTYMFYQGMYYKSFATIQWCYTSVMASKTPHNHPPPWYQGSWGQHGAHLGPTGPRWAPCWPHELCYLGTHSRRKRTHVRIHFHKIRSIFKWEAQTREIQKKGVIFFRHNFAKVWKWVKLCICLLFFIRV